MFLLYHLMSIKFHFVWIFWSANNGIVAFCGPSSPARKNLMRNYKSIVAMAYNGFVWFGHYPVRTCAASGKVISRGW